MGVMSYLSSPLWMMFLLFTGIEAYIQTQAIPVYFFSDRIEPVWPVSFKVEMNIVLIFTLAMLFLPKLMALIVIASNRKQRCGFGGLLRATVSALLETVFSILVAPILMLYQTRFVWAILFRRSIGWPTQQRGDHRTRFSEAVSAHAMQTMIALAAGLVSYFYVPDYFWWLSPVLCGALLSIPISIFSSSIRLGRIARQLGLFVTPEERQQPLELEYFNTAMIDVSQRSSSACNTLRAPYAHAMHTALLPNEVLSRRQQHYLQGLLYKVIDEGLTSLSPEELHDLFSHEVSLRELHCWIWSTNPSKEASN
jgi:membrane glycosyltransferase